MPRERHQEDGPLALRGLWPGGAPQGRSGKGPHRYWAPGAAFSEGARLRRTRAELGFRVGGLGTGAPQALHGTRRCGSLQESAFSGHSVYLAGCLQGRGLAVDRGLLSAAAVGVAGRQGRMWVAGQGLRPLLGPVLPRACRGHCLLCTCRAQVPGRCLATRVTDRLELFPAGFSFFFLLQELNTRSFGWFAFLKIYFEKVTGTRLHGRPRRGAPPPGLEPSPPWGTPILFCGLF